MSVHDEGYFRNVRTVLYIYVFINTTMIVKTARKKYLKINQYINKYRRTWQDKNKHIQNRKPLEEKKRKMMTTKTFSK